MIDLLEKFGQYTQSAAQKLHVRSALNPMLWLSAISTPLCLTFAYVFKEIPEVRNWLLWIGLTPIGVTCLGFIGFAIFRPEKLQSEEYQIRHESLQIIQQKSGRIAIPATSIEAIANPQARQIDYKEGKNA